MLIMKHTVRVKPGASRQKIETLDSGEIVLWVRAKPVDGQANEAVIRALAEHWGIAKSRISIKSGLSSKTKVVEVR